MSEFDRRDFLKLVGVGAGTAAATGCSEPVNKLIPYVVQPEEITPGIAVVYASTCQECSAGCGLHVRTRESRPIKLEGNPDHPINRGALCPAGQAAIVRPYHPDRFRGPMQRGADGGLSPISWKEATELFATKVREAGSGTSVFTGPTGPTLSGLVDQWVAAVGAGSRVVYDAFAPESLATASEAVFGSASRPVFDLSDTDVVVDFGADSLGTWISPVEHARQLSDARNVATPEGKRARLVYVGPRLSTTAASADEWLPAKPGTEGILALAIARAAWDKGAGRAAAEDPAVLERLLAPFDAASASTRTEVPAESIRRIGAELAAAKRPAALPPGVELTGRNATATTAAVLILNAVVGAVGRSVQIVSRPASEDPAAEDGSAAPSSFKDVLAAVDSMKSGRVKVLVVDDSNPLYSLPAASGFAEALDKVGFVVSTATMPDETSEKAHLILPDHAALEGWGDASPRPGVRSIVQPTLRPLFDTQAFGDTLLEVGRAVSAEAGAALPEGSFRGVLEAAWAGTDWRAALARGGVFRDESETAAPPVSAGVSRLRFEEPALDGDGRFTLLANPGPMVGDGRGANLPWLQETPDPVTKISWQSWAEVSRKVADELGVNMGDVLAVETAAGTLELPVFPRGGIRDDVVAIQTGQGHTVGRFASRPGFPTGVAGEVRGVNVTDALPAATDDKGVRAWMTTRASVRVTGAHERVAHTQYSDNKRGRQLGEMVTLASLEHEPAHFEGEEHGAGHDGPHEILRPFDPADDAVDDSAYRWGLTIDLDRCTGCSACAVACSVENNIPTVGEEAVLRSRQMSWLRVERFIGDGYQQLETGRPPHRDHEELGSTDVRHSIMLCQQCGAATCEPVCPVIATYHTPQGLNGMIYNRCIGTRYCSNNCPYKVRRFNWFDYAIHNWPEPMNLMLNPDVTVRGQGVMEKCTFCIQRIQEGRQPAKDEGRDVRDGEIQTACQQTCPTSAITFGNMRDEKSQAVQKAKNAGSRKYHALHVLNTRPAVTYLARVARGKPGGEA